MDSRAKSSVEETRIMAIVHRKDGTTENLGTVAYWHRNPLKRLLFKLRKK